MGRKGKTGSVTGKIHQMDTWLRDMHTQIYNFRKDKGGANQYRCEMQSIEVSGKDQKQYREPNFEIMQKRNGKERKEEHEIEGKNEKIVTRRGVQKWKRKAAENGGQDSIKAWRKAFKENKDKERWKKIKESNSAKDYRK